MEEIVQLPPIADEHDSEAGCCEKATLNTLSCDTLPGTVSFSCESLVDARVADEAAAKARMSAAELVAKHPEKSAKELVQMLVTIPAPPKTKEVTNAYLLAQAAPRRRRSVVTLPPGPAPDLLGPELQRLPCMRELPLLLCTEERPWSTPAVVACERDLGGGHVRAPRLYDVPLVALGSEETEGGE